MTSLVPSGPVARDPQLLPQPLIQTPSVGDTRGRAVTGVVASPQEPTSACPGTREAPCPHRLA